MHHCGIDVSKATLQVHLLEPEWARSVPNTPAGHHIITERLARLDGPCRVVVEATASYSTAIARAVSKTDGCEVMVANPRATKAFSKVINQRGKSDPQDARMLAYFAKTTAFREWTPPSPEAETLRQIMRRREQLVDLRRMEKQRKAEAKSINDTYLVEAIDRVLKFLNEEIASIEKEASKHAGKYELLAAWVAALMTIPGVAKVTALLVVSELACLPDDLDAKQLTAYAGLDPQSHQSGKTDWNRGISRRGNRRLRSTLYLAAWNTSRCSPEIGEWRQRLIERGKAPKLAYIAVARKLLLVSYAMRKKPSTWDGSRFGTKKSP